MNRSAPTKSGWDSPPSGLLDDVNPAQREAITYMDGPLLVIAGAGSGKTRVITRRLAWLLGSGVRPREVLAITFTNKAAGEMRERVEELVGPNECWVMTFHSFCARLLRREAERLGYGRNFSIYDEDDALRAVKDGMAACNISDKEWRPQAIRAAISDAKSADRAPEELDDGSYQGRVTGQVYTHYAQALMTANAMDFDDLLCNVVRLFREDEEAADRWQHHFAHVLIDEYQDTNRAQYLIARHLTEKSRQLCATGDPDQSIYAWRGADIRNILDFEEGFPEAKVVRLEQNYRSTRTILRAAGAMIERNSMRRERGLWTENSEGDSIRLLTLDDEREEAEAIVDAVLEAADAGRSLREIAVFYRTNAQSRPIEEAFLQAGLRYQVIGALEFYGRREIKDALAWLRLVGNPKDAAAFKRAVAAPRRGVGPGAMARLTQFAMSQSISLLDAARRAGEAKIADKARRALEKFAGLIDAFHNGPQSPVADVVRRLLVESGLSDSLDPTTDRTRLENLDALVGAAASHDEEPDADLTGFLEQVALVTGIDDHDPDEDCVSLMSLHMAKGLEFPLVIIPGIEEGLLPHMMSLSDNPDVGEEEERRLFYVGMTRAMEKLALTHTVRRMRWGRSQRAKPSRFLEELPPDCLDHYESPRAAIMRNPAPASSGDGRYYDKDADMEPEYDADEDYGRSMRNVDFDGMTLEVGAKVRHPRFGVGSVTNISGFGLTAKVTVRFKSRKHGTKKLSAAHARLEPM